MIPLLNNDGEHIGFLLPAGLPEDFEATPGTWEAECIFMPLPAEAGLLDDPSFALLERHKEAGEHHLVASNDGEALSFIATSPAEEKLFFHLPADTDGSWGTLESDGSAAQMGYAVRVSGEDA